MGDQSARLVFQVGVLGGTDGQGMVELLDKLEPGAYGMQLVGLFW
jgi:hypothetical protein